jgi:sugar lactone lactonase YvrE
MVEAIFNIWFNKDYTLYAQITNNQNLTIENWQPSNSMYFFIRKDIATEIWEYGIPATTSGTVVTDPYEGKYTDLLADQYFGESGTSFGELNTAHGIAVAPNGYIYIADSGNNRIEYFTNTGVYLGSWGTYATAADSNSPAPSGTFNEPWGVAVGPDGSVYVTDTWNNRIQKFTADGKFITMWGTGGLGDTPTSFYGPRGIAVDANGRVYITDTGNKRVVVFDQDGNYIAQFGSSGMENGQFDEPVGIAVDANGLVYVADTWNYRIQVFAPDTAGTTYNFIRSWAVDGWNTQSAQNKPFLTLDSAGNVYVTDPDNYRVIQYDITGNVIQVWGNYSAGIDGFGLPVGIVADSEGHVWVVDAVNNRVLRFVPNASTSVNNTVTSLPAFPKALIALNFDPSTNQLMDSLGQAYYTLDINRGIWVPIIPADIAATLPEGTTEIVDTLGLWYINDANGMSIYQWNQGALMWMVVVPASPTK